MAGRGASKPNLPKARKIVDATESPATVASLVRAKDGSAFARCEECNKNVPVALISMHSCSLEAKIKMNLEVQVVEIPAEVKKPAERKRSISTEPKAKKAKTDKSNKGKDPNMPKRPPTAFFLFMDDFRKEYKEASPNSKDVKLVAKQGGEKWRSMTDEEKKPYLDKVADLKAEYEKALESYNAEDEDGEDRSSDKEASVKEVSDGE
ncbi:High mobility group B protein like [Quillaja saponaria]|uniref:High mobility group B protein like n=1 Tax=Quillaja saponaria TaxID=32244 RepID=A0AAD7KMM0_QUISA|nr:High mobility group B protein like [Quillaja saponaria]KAJ7942605.1 High mobility group B protein like [Quillaja saponaria]